MKFLIVFAAAVLASAAAWAVVPDVADPRAGVPEVRYDSVFASYRAVSQVTLEDWARLNAVVGGHRLEPDPVPPDAAFQDGAEPDRGPRR